MLSDLWSGNLSAKYDGASCVKHFDIVLTSDLRSYLTQLLAFYITFWSDTCSDTLSGTNLGMNLSFCEIYYIKLCLSCYGSTIWGSYDLFPLAAGHARWWPQEACASCASPFRCHLATSDTIDSQLTRGCSCSFRDHQWSQPNKDEFPFDRLMASHSSLQFCLALSAGLAVAPQSGAPAICFPQLLATHAGDPRKPVPPVLVRSAATLQQVIRLILNWREAAVAASVTTNDPNQTRMNSLLTVSWLHTVACNSASHWVHVLLWLHNLGLLPFVSFSCWPRTLVAPRSLCFSIPRPPCNNWYGWYRLIACYGGPPVTAGDKNHKHPFRAGLSQE